MRCINRVVRERLSVWNGVTKKIATVVCGLKHDLKRVVIFVVLAHLACSTKDVLGANVTSGLEAVADRSLLSSSTDLDWIKRHD